MPETGKRSGYTLLPHFFVDDAAHSHIWILIRIHFFLTKISTAACNQMILFAVHLGSSEVTETTFVYSIETGNASFETVVLNKGLAQDLKRKFQSLVREINCLYYYLCKKM